MKPIPNYSGYYIDKDGSVYSDHRGELRRVTPRPAHNGYLRVYLRNDLTKARQDKYIHRLVAEAFLRRKKHLDIVNHKDYDRTNNSVDNLEWVDSAGNNLYTLDQNRLLRNSLGQFESVPR